MRYVVYIDRLFLLQFVQSCILLLLTRAFLHSAAALKRIIFASAAGALLFCIILLLPDAGRRMKILLFACSSLVTLEMAFRIRTLQHFCKAVILYHGAAFPLAGALNALYGAFGRAPFMDTIQASALSACNRSHCTVRPEMGKDKEGRDSDNRNPGRRKRAGDAESPDRQRQQPV